MAFRFRPAHVIAGRRIAARLQLLFLCIPVIYLLGLTGLIAYRSSKRASVLAGGLDAKLSPAEELADISTGWGSKVQLEDFHRVEIKSGKVVWEVNAKDAKFYPLDSVIHVNSVSLKVFDEKHDNVEVQADAAKLYRSENSLNKAILDGNIRIAIGDGLTVETESAEFDGQERIFLSPGKVNIEGEGFHVEGQGFRFFIESGILSFANAVECRFSEGAQIPKGTL